MAILDVKGLRAIVRRMGAPARGQAAEQAMQRVMALLEKKAVELAPNLTGNLEASTVVTIQVEARKIRGTLAFVTPYAAAQHEGLDPITGRAYSPGPYTARKPGNEFGPAGPKFLERPLAGARTFLPAEVAEAIQAAWAEAR